MKIILGLFLALSFSACKKREIITVPIIPTNKTYLALGDSYTVGDAINQEESFPYLLVAQLNTAGVKTEPPHVIANTGWTTTSLLTALSQEKIDEKYDFVTVLIGVNNQYVKKSIDQYRKDFVEILNTAVAHSRGGRATVYVISIPDWTVTPFGKLKDTKAESASVDQYNAVNKQESINASVNYIDITPASRIADLDESYTSQDGLHPSGKMYLDWVKKLYPLVRKELN